MATGEMVISGLKEPHFRRLMQEWGVPTLAKLEDIWTQDTGHTLGDDFANKLVQLEKQTPDWTEKVARANKVSRFIDISFLSTTATEEQLVQLAREQGIEEPIFRLDGGATF